MSHKENFDTATRKLDITNGTVSCGTCNKTINLSECAKKEEQIKEGNYTYKLSYFHNECKELVVGVCV